MVIHATLWPSAHISAEYCTYHLTVESIGTPGDVWKDIQPPLNSFFLLLVTEDNNSLRHGRHQEEDAGHEA